MENAIMEVKPNEILFIYNSNQHLDKKGLGYVHSLKHYKVKDIDISQDSLTEQQYAELALKMNIEPGDLADKKSSKYKENLDASDLSKEDILIALKNNPNLVKTPIVVYHDRAEFVGSGYQFVRQDMATSEIKMDSANKEEMKPKNQ